MDHTDEYEQGERVRAWLRENGSSLVGGVALGLACLLGWNWWQDRGEQAKYLAATEFHAFSKALEAGEENKAKAHLSVLQTEFPTLPYATLAALRQADALQKQGKFDEAVAALDAAPADGIDPTLRALCQLRAARLLLESGKADAALARLDAAVEDAYPALAAELRGDAELARGNRDAARDAYNRALVALDVAAQLRG
ncbi:YfgM family protein, partial [Arenimonas composti]